MTKLLTLIAVAVLAFAGCQQGTEQTAKNSNADQKPAEDLKTALSKLENDAYEAWKKKDGKFFEDMLTDGFVANGSNGPSMKADTIKGISDNPCEVKSYKISDVKVTEVGEGVAILTARNELDYTCKDKDGKDVAGPSPGYAASLYVKTGDKWQATYHQTVPASDAKGEQVASAGEEGDKQEAKSDDADEMTKTLEETEKKFWEGWAKKDTKVFEDGLASNFSEIGPEGYMDRAAAIKSIAEHKCEVKRTTLADSKAVKINDNLYLFMTKGSSEGACDGQPMPEAMHGTTLYAKDGDAWKPVFHTATPGA